MRKNPDERTNWFAGHLVKATIRDIRSRRPILIPYDGRYPGPEFNPFGTGLLVQPIRIHRGRVYFRRLSLVSSGRRLLLPAGAEGSFLLTRLTSSHTRDPDSYDMEFWAWQNYSPVTGRWRTLEDAFVPFVPSA